MPLLVANAKALGFDLLEIAVEDPDAFDVERLRQAGESAGIGFTVCGAIGPDRDLSHEDPEIRANALAYIERCVEIAAALGAPHFVGPLYSAVGKTRMLEPHEREAQRTLAVEGLKRAAEHAAKHDVSLGVEPLNRFETDLVNTAEQVLELVDRVDSDHVGVLLDTFHMNIDEKSIGDAIRLVGDQLLQVHTCENDRGTPGTGHFPWGDLFEALKDIGFQGPLVIESFTPGIEEIAKAVSLWRPLDAEPDELARNGAAFLRSALTPPIAA
ncbi:sugar phosphate isomerase/epimerase [Solirubrobacter phytolaccae]|uniref:Sugar phosphate isomerase/epimerase n=1 Tax=Solirubrobacter phytolaccae TaxID=1404360 RepID=A0A9X3SA88_9ACTN|nr:sugar phosphate isomerase/epimerase family protein [Solirubrobacter phytolaccae]MDA0180065.1 sugar phosphate isomerase/epimerase [Solirubrobacter phytolaccae]